MNVGSDCARVDRYEESGDCHDAEIQTPHSFLKSKEKNKKRKRNRYPKRDRSKKRVSGSYAGIVFVSRAAKSLTQHCFRVRVTVRCWTRAACDATRREDVSWSRVVRLNARPEARRRTEAFGRFRRIAESIRPRSRSRDEMQVPVTHSTSTVALYVVHGTCTTGTGYAVVRGRRRRRWVAPPPHPREALSS